MPDARCRQFAVILGILGVVVVVVVVVAGGACGRVDLFPAEPADASVADAPAVTDLSVDVAAISDALREAPAGDDVLRDASEAVDGGSVCAVPLAPVLSVIAVDEVLSFAAVGGAAIEIATLPAAAPLSSAAFQVRNTLPLAGLSGPTRVRAQTGAICVAAFDATYDIRATYAPAPPDVATTAIAHDDTRIVAWARSVEVYEPGPDLSAAWMMTNKALGPAGTSTLDVVSLGNGGRITLTFDAPITDGAGWDFAVFENSFANDLFLELAFVEVSSDGTHFVRFDSAFRGPATPCASCSGTAKEIGGLAGSYRVGFGTPFDLAALRNSPAVRDGSVDLTVIRNVRVVDIVGDGTTQDSFGRPIIDPIGGGPSAGFDLDAIGVLNRRL